MTEICASHMRGLALVVCITSDTREGRAMLTSGCVCMASTLASFHNFPWMESTGYRYLYRYTGYIYSLQYFYRYILEF